MGKGLTYLIMSCTYGAGGGGGHTVFGVNPIGVGIGAIQRLRDIFLSAHYLVNQWLDSYQIFMNI